MRFTIKLKLGLTFAAIIVLSAATAVLGISSLSSLDANLQGMVAGPVERMQTGEEMFIALLQVVRGEKNIILSTAPEQIAQYDRQIQQARLDFAAKLDHGESVASVEGKPKWAAIRDIWPQYLAADDKLRDFAKRGETAKAVEVSLTDLRTLVADV
jgi:methyl-accepting chemotaxis protein